MDGVAGLVGIDGWLDRMDGIAGWSYWREEQLVLDQLVLLGQLDPLRIVGLDQDHNRLDH